MAQGHRHADSLNRQSEDTEGAGALAYASVGVYRLLVDKRNLAAHQHVILAHRIGAEDDEAIDVDAASRTA